MSGIGRAIKATYNFFSGDAVLLLAVAIAFIGAWALLHVANMPMVVAGLVFVTTITAGLVSTLVREVVGQTRRGWTPSGWSDLGDVDLDTGVKAGGPIGRADERDATFPDGNNAAGLIGDASLPTGLPFESSLLRRANREEKPAAKPQEDDGMR